jgi:hypothetical protein
MIYIEITLLVFGLWWFCNYCLHKGRTERERIEKEDKFIKDSFR